MKRFLVGALGLAAACVPAPARTQAAPSPAGDSAPPAAAWVAAFEHLFEISGAVRTDPPIAYCVEVGSEVHSAEVMAELRARAPEHAPQACVQANDYQTTPEGREAWRFWVGSIYRSGVRYPGRWAVEIGYIAGPLDGSFWRCRLNESNGAWTLDECERTLTS